MSNGLAVWFRRDRGKRNHGQVSIVVGGVPAGLTLSSGTALYGPELSNRCVAVELEDRVHHVAHRSKDDDVG
ncbi:glycine/D-amino acid oxidase, deaminating [Anopheles sinensis]|uniref:Glycine/D-amino acid oxidase, deaminating n=1 Tax=Anopheles sinensis TaxID=74873 RepID=A0A084VKR4_ANOSI|nr:glycine/D-amino acid oxidase, deaminating [Anopheles sinensis]